MKKTEAMDMREQRRYHYYPSPIGVEELCGWNSRSRDKLTFLASKSNPSMMEYVVAIERIVQRITEEYDDETFAFPILGLDQMDEWIETMHGVLRDFATLRDKFAPHVMNEFPHVSQEVSQVIVCRKIFILLDKTEQHSTS